MTLYGRRGNLRRRVVAQELKQRFTVSSSKANPYDETASPALMEIHLSETFAGDIAGESRVRALQVLRDDVEDGKIKGTWFVVPGSGTADLTGLRGAGGFESRFGEASAGVLDYWFE